MNNREIAGFFHRLADLLELRDENPFKVRSYRAAAETIEETPTPLTEIYAEGGAAALEELPGVGKAISKKIAELIETGTFPLYQSITAEIPESVLSLLQVEGIGIKTLQILYRQFQLTNLEDFAKFVDGGGLESVPRLSERSQARIRQSLRKLL